MTRRVSLSAQYTGKRSVFLVLRQNTTTLRDTAVEVQSHLFLTSTLNWNEWSTNVPKLQSPLHPLNRKVDRESVGRCREEKKSLVPARNRRPTLMLVIIYTELPPIPNVSCKDAHQYVTHCRGDVELRDQLKRCALRKTWLFCGHLPWKHVLLETFTDRHGTADQKT